MKADQFPEWHKKWAEKNPGVIELFTTLADVRGQETVKEWAEKIVRQHRPTPQLDLPDFMQPREEQISSAAAAAPIVVVSQTKPTAPVAEKRKLACATCGTKISFAEGRFCWNNEQRFGGYQYCREHQAAL